MAFTESWVESNPDGDVITVSQLDDSDRLIKRAVRERLEGDPASTLSGIYESGTFAGTAIVKAGSARAWAVADAAVSGLTRQDGRMAFTTDAGSGHPKLYHLKSAGVLEIAYLNRDGSRMMDGHLKFQTDNTYDVGAAGANRPKNLYLAGTAFVDDITGSATHLNITTTSSIFQIITSHATGNLLIQASGTDAQVNIKGGGANGFIALFSGGQLKWTLLASGHLEPAVTDNFNVGTSTKEALGVYAANLLSNNQVVVRQRKTGWATWTGTANRATKDTASATLTDVAQTLKALIDDLHATAGHGLIGT